MSKRTPYLEPGYFRQVADWVPVGAVPFFAYACQCRDICSLKQMREWALEGAKVLRALRPGPQRHVGKGGQLSLL